MIYTIENNKLNIPDIKNYSNIRIIDMKIKNKYISNSEYKKSKVVPVKYICVICNLCINPIYSFVIDVKTQHIFLKTLYIKNYTNAIETPIFYYYDDVIFTFIDSNNNIIDLDIDIIIELI